MPLKWEFPGGKIEPGEDEESALRRELQEELGILATIGPKLTTIRYTYDHQASIELHFYLVEAFQGEIRNLIFEDVYWADLKELPNYDFLEADVAMVRDIASGKMALTGQAQRRSP